MRKILTEILWLAGCFVLAGLLIFLISRGNFNDTTIDLHIHDTYFVINRFPIFFCMSLLIVFAIFFVKEYRKSFNHSVANWIILLTGASLIVAVTSLVRILSMFTMMGWTSYPPLSAMPQENTTTINEDTGVKFILNSLTALQVIIATMMSFVSYRWGKRRKG